MRAKGFAFPVDTPWQRELEDSFPYEETPDQLRAIDEVKDDMESDRPMDRLVCGDVGYGKTEIAVRAAFKAVNAGKQVAVLVPTTILAQQHHATFVERFRNFPVRVEMLSRFLSAAESKKVIADVGVGKVDVVVGTHRLLGKDVAFSDLGLVVIDEEQRFGVDQKEKLKALRTSVDVLTLTATPIPRTLEMAMAGIRDMSIVDTPPEDRHPVMTYVGEYEEDVVISAVGQLLRDGQVFYVHPRVQTIDHAANRARTRARRPRRSGARPDGREATRGRDARLRRCKDERARVHDDHRVGPRHPDREHVDRRTMPTYSASRRCISSADASGAPTSAPYAYLFFPPTRALTEGAHERLKTIAEHTGLGSGFRIAMRDLEIRGAGNMLGAEQHGHIEEIGFDLYVRLVAQAVEEARGEALPRRTTRKCASTFRSTHSSRRATSRTRTFGSRLIDGSRQRVQKRT